MNEDREKWNAMYQRSKYSSDFAEIVEKYAPRPDAPAQALDIASGIGVHSRYLARLGYAVDAVDISEVALADLDDLTSVNAHCEDLDSYEILESHYDLIVQVKYCGRHLFPMMVEGLKEEGMLIFETFMQAPNSNELSFPYQRKYLLRPNELLRVFGNLRTLYYEESSTLGNDGSLAWKASFVGVKVKTW